MGRAQRIHLRQGVYLLEQKRSEPPLFRTQEDYVRFCIQLPALTRRTRVRVHAFCLLPIGFYFAAQVDEIPLSRFMLLLMRRCATIFTSPGEESVAHPRYRALLVDPQEYFLPLVRYLHWLPELEHFDSMDAYRWSSHHAYLQRTKISWLSTAGVRRAIGGRSQNFVSAYQALMAQRPTDLEVRNFERGNPWDARRLGRSLFPLRHDADLIDAATALDVIVTFVAEMYEMTEAQLISRAERKRAPEARALIAWFAKEFDYAELKASAARLHRAPSTLSQSITLHKGMNPLLFSRQAGFVAALMKRLPG